MGVIVQFRMLDQALRHNECLLWKTLQPKNSRQDGCWLLIEMKSENAIVGDVRISDNAL